MATTQSFSGSDFQTIYYGRASRWSSSSAQQGVYQKTSETDNSVGLMVFSGLSGIPWASKVITGASITITTSAASYNYTKKLRLYGSNYAYNANVTGASYISGHGCFDVDAYAVYGPGTFTLYLSADNISSILGELIDGTTAFCCYMAGESSSSGQSTNRMCITSATLSITYEESSTAPSASNGTLGSAVRITTNGASGLTHTLTYSFAGSNGTIASGVVSYYDWTPPLSLAANIPNANSGTCTITCYTYSGSVMVGQRSCTITLSVPSTMKPTISSVSLSEAVAGIAAQFGAFVQTKSKLTVNVSASGTYGSSISAYQITINGATYNANGCTTGLLTTSGTCSYSVRVSDSRGIVSDTYTGYFSVVAYSDPSVNASADRLSSPNTSATVYFSWTISPVAVSGSNKNRKQLNIYYKLRSTSTWTKWGSTITPSTFSGSSSTTITGLSAESEYDIRVDAVDYFGTISYSVRLSSDSAFIIDIDTEGHVAFNMESTGEGTEFMEDVVFHGQARFTDYDWLIDAIFPIGSIRMTTTTTGAANFLGGTWEQWGKGRVPVGVDTSDSSFSSAGLTGGAKTVTLNIYQIPIHQHDVGQGTITVSIQNGGLHAHTASNGSYKVGSGSGSNYLYMTNDGYTSGQNTGQNGEHGHTASLSGYTSNCGGNQSHNNLQPYITCYFYKRTA